MFLACDRLHRDLHSFPTRRSSDLAVGEAFCRKDPTRRGTGPPRRAPERFCRQRRSRRSEEHTSELQSHSDIVCRLLLEKKKSTANLSMTVTDRCYRTT